MAIAKATEKRFLIIPWWKEVSDSLEAGDFEDVRLSLYNFSFKRVHQAVRTQEYGPHRQLLLSLLQPSNITACGLCLPDRPRTQIEDLVATVLYLVEEVSNTVMTPVVAKTGEHMAEHVRFSDGAIHV